MFRCAALAVLSLALISATPATEPAQPATDSRNPVVAANLAANPRDIVAVFRPVDQRAVAVFVGKPGQALNVIVFHDSREAGALFDQLWDNAQFVKDPGDDDARPLTRMLVKGADRRSATLIANTNRILAISYDSDDRVARVYLDRPPGAPLPDPNTSDERDHLIIPDFRQQAENALAAYKACVVSK